MKFTYFSYLIAASVMALMACNDNTSNNTSTSEAEKETTTTNDTSNVTNANEVSNVPEETASFTNVDPKAAASVNEVVTHYLHVKNALADDNDKEAAKAANQMATAIGKVDHASLKEDQMKLYMDVAESLKEHAEHTAANAGNIVHQREHFVMMSEDMYDLVKGFGAEQALYVDHCPMANKNKGANWLSEKKEISNPYMGKKMPKCGKVEKVIQ